MMPGIERVDRGLLEDGFLEGRLEGLLRKELLQE